MHYRYTQKAMGNMKKTGNKKARTQPKLETNQQNPDIYLFIQAEYKPAKSRYLV